MQTSLETKSPSNKPSPKPGTTPRHQCRISCGLHSSVCQLRREKRLDVAIAEEGSTTCTARMLRELVPLSQTHTASGANARAETVGAEIDARRERLATTQAKSCLLVSRHPPRRRCGRAGI